MKLIKTPLILLVALSLNTLAKEHARSDKPPAGLSVDTVPQFVSIGFDDVNDLDGIDWTLQMLAGLNNPKGQGKAATFDGKPVLASFFPNCGEAKSNPGLVKAWRKIYSAGHELGNHTLEHVWGQHLTVDQWQAQIQGCMNILSLEVGVKAAEINGFRAPFLMYNDAMFKAVVQAGLKYDVSVTEGLDSAHHSGNQVWPFTMDKGLKAAEFAYWLPKIKSHSGLWLLPLHVLAVVPDDKTLEYGLKYSLKAKLQKTLAGLNTNVEKLTPFDHNLFSSDKWMYGLTKDEALAVLKYNLDQRLKGNRAPMILGFHSVNLNGKPMAHIKNTSAEDRREVLKAFLIYALSKEAVRVVRHQDVIQWMGNPISLFGQR